MNFPITITKDVYDRIKAEQLEEIIAQNWQYVYEAQVIIDFLEGLCDDT